MKIKIVNLYLKSKRGKEFNDLHLLNSGSVPIYGLFNYTIK